MTWRDGDDTLVLAVSAALLQLVLLVPVVTVFGALLGFIAAAHLSEGGIRMKMTASAIDVREQGGAAAGGAVAPVARPGRRRDEFEALGLLLGVLVVLAVTIGAARLTTRAGPVAPAPAPG